MKIEFKKSDPALEIIECIIREAEYETDVGFIRKPHFQANISSANLKCEQNSQYAVSYYDSDDNFLGLDSDTLWINAAQNKQVTQISLPLNIPEGAKKAVFSFNLTKKPAFSFYSIMGKVAVLLGILILSAWLLEVLIRLKSA